MPSALPDPESILPVPDVPQPPQPPHLTIGKGGRAPQAPRFRAKRAPHAPGNPANKPQPAKIIHIHQGMPAVKQPAPPAPAPAAKPASQAAQQRGAVHQAMGQRIAQRMQGMPAKNQQLFQSLLRAHGQQHVKGYHQAGGQYLKDQLAQIRFKAQQARANQPPKPQAGAPAQPGSPVANAAQKRNAQWQALQQQAQGLPMGGVQPQNPPPPGLPPAGGSTP